MMTRADVPKCSDPMEYVTRHYGKPLDNGRLIAIRFSFKGTPHEQYLVFGLIMDITLRNKPDWLKASNTSASVKDKGFGNTLYKCNPKEFELAVLLERLIPIFAPKPLAALTRQFRENSVFPVSGAHIPENIEIKDVFSLGTTRSARELRAVANTPASRVVRSLGYGRIMSFPSHLQKQHGHEKLCQHALVFGGSHSTPCPDWTLCR